MQRTDGVDSVVLQVSGDGDLSSAKKIEAVLGGYLEILKHFPIKPTKEARKSWRDATGRQLPSTAVFVALLHHPRGQSLILLRYATGKGLEVHFHGLQQYECKELIISDGAVQRRTILDEFLSVWDEPIKLSRLDRCVDLVGVRWGDYSNTRTHRSLCKRQGTALFKKTTVYYQPPKRRYVKITAYSKEHSNKLNYPLVRVEFSFLGQYWSNSKAIHPSKIIEMAEDRADAHIKRVLSS